MHVCVSVCVYKAKYQVFRKSLYSLVKSISNKRVVVKTFYIIIISTIMFTMYIHRAA